MVRRLLRFVLSLALLPAFVATASAQEVPHVATDMSKQKAPFVPGDPGPWITDCNLALLVTQSAFTNNWAKGDKGSFSWAATGDLTAERQFSHRFNWKNFGRVSYGQTANQVADASNPGKNRWEAPNKTTDQILGESTGRFTLGGFADPFVGLRAESQFVDQSSPYGSLNFNPLRLTETAGLAKIFEKTETTELSSRLGIGARQTFGKEFLEEGRSTRSFTTNDAGIEWLTICDEPIAKPDRIFYRGRLLVFAPLYYSQSDDLERFDEAALAIDPTRESVADFWRVPDVDFQNEFIAKVTKLISVNLLVQIVYDKYDANTNVAGSRPPQDLIPLVDGAIRKDVQVRETLALGLNYKLF